MAPDCRATSRPPRNAIIVGMPRIPKRPAMSGTSSVLSFAMRTSDASRSAAWLVRGRHHPAWTAPRRPEIDDDRQIVRRDVLVEVRLAERDRVAGKQRLLAGAASRARALALARDTVRRIAARTHDVDAPAHLLSPLDGDVGCRATPGRFAPGNYEGALWGINPRGPA